MEFQKAIDFLQKKFAELQTGRASTALVENLEIDIYGTLTPLKHCANLSVSDGRQILVNPWDAKIIVEIEKAISRRENLGVSFKNEGNFLRLEVLPLNAERRGEIIREAKKMAEEARIAVRTARGKKHDELKKQKTDGEISEDEFFRAEKDLQKEVDAANEKVEEMFAKKEKEISTV
jgi:ribosome recycling factor